MTDKTLEQLRKEAGFTTVQSLAERIGVSSHARLSEWERRKHKPGANFIRPWARALGITADELLRLLGL